MKTTTFTTECPCGHKLTAKIGKPTRMEARRGRMKCPECLSHFMVTASVDQTKHGRHFLVKFEEIEITQRALDIVAVDMGLKEAP